MTRADIIDALQRATEFIEDPDQQGLIQFTGTSTIPAATATPVGQIARAEREVERLKREQKAAQKIRDLLARLKADEAIVE